MHTDMAPVIYWFRQDLRLTDLPALHAAIDSGKPVLPCFVIDPQQPWKPGEASRWWLYQSLQALAADIAELGGRLLVRRGHSATAIRQLIVETGASEVYCSQAYDPWSRKMEQTLARDLGARLHCLPGSLLLHPEQVRKKNGEPFKVFTPFWRAGRTQLEVRHPLPRPAPGCFMQHQGHSLSPEAWKLLPSPHSWHAHWAQLWTPGEVGATAAMHRFMDRGLTNYSEARDYPAEAGTSRLSAHLHWGEISPGTVLHALQSRAVSEADSDKFSAELAWREFNHHLLYHYPQICEQPLKPHFRALPWNNDPDSLAAWEQGRTGYPLVDAGMRELWHTGFMHNRVRMICASFLCKHLLLPWQWGALWFWNTLVDADLANNSAGWQWVAGCGSDASPWFRIFNPVLQSRKFDADGNYIRRWLPELANLSARHIHAPWEAPAAVLQEADITLGATYPQPLVDHGFARQRALQAYTDLSDDTPAS